MSASRLQHRATFAELWTVRLVPVHLGQRLAQHALHAKVRLISVRLEYRFSGFVLANGQGVSRDAHRERRVLGFAFEHDAKPGDLFLDFSAIVIRSKT